ncbi:MAG: hypothetical protein EP330_13500 [Deltaproteobacteria bacterium]|nr:MAG: hypothetical protein EP330_13500 [Deltaproteobacteria bacterium]
MDSHWASLLRDQVAGERWLVAMDVAVPAARLAKALLELGAESVFALGASRGTGDLAEVPTRWLDVRGEGMMGGIRASEQALIGPLPPEVRAAIDAWDPEHRARVVRPLFSGPEPVADRPVWGARQTAWMALEDKTVVDAVWDAIGVARAPSEVVTATAEALRAAARKLDEGHGTVWAGDNKLGWHGGAAYTRWVRHDADEAAALDLLLPACDAVRVMPFLEGVPCSIHGICVPDGTDVVLRPCEMIVLRREDGRFFYAAAATFWDPSPADREAMRDVARRAARWLREERGYRGVFTVDGVLTADGFRPTELNPRFGGAIMLMSSAIPGADLYLLHLAMMANPQVDWRGEALEQAILAHADAHRSGRFGTVVAASAPPERVELVVTPTEVRPAADGETPDAVAEIGPAHAGAYFNVRPIPERTPVGPPAGPLAARLVGWADAHWGLGIGPLTASENTR